MDLKKAFGTDSNLENEGAWVDLGDGASIKVARVGNKANRACLKKLVAPHKIAVRNDKLPDDVWEKITIQAIAETILLDWKGIKDDGKDVPYTLDNAVRLLTDYKDFRELVATSSNELAIFQNQTQVEATKN